MPKLEVTDELLHQALQELGIDGSYWYRARRDAKIEIWTPYARKVWTPPWLRGEKDAAPLAKAQKKERGRQAGACKRSKAK